jgi:uncharacterized membrane protein YtjA (UPF0391 family)
MREPGTRAGIIDERNRELPMLKWAVVFLIIAIIAGLLGFSDVEAVSATIAKWLFGIFLVLFIGAVVIGLVIGKKLTS